MPWHGQQYLKVNLWASHFKTETSKCIHKSNSVIWHTKKSLNKLFCILHSLFFLLSFHKRNSTVTCFLSFTVSIPVVFIYQHSDRHGEKQGCWNTLPLTAKSWRGWDRLKTGQVVSCSFDQPLRTDRVTAEATSVLWPIHLPAERGQEWPKGNRQTVEVEI